MQSDYKAIHLTTASTCCLLWSEGKIIPHFRQDSYYPEKWKEIYNNIKNRGGVFIYMENKEEK